MEADFRRIAKVGSLFKSRLCVPQYISHENTRFMQKFQKKFKKFLRSKNYTPLLKIFLSYDIIIISFYD